VCFRPILRPSLADQRYPLAPGGPISAPRQRWHEINGRPGDKTGRVLQEERARPTAPVYLFGSWACRPPSAASSSRRPGCGAFEAGGFQLGRHGVGSANWRRTSVEERVHALPMPDCSESLRDLRPAARRGSRSGGRHAETTPACGQVAGRQCKAASVPVSDVFWVAPFLSSPRKPGPISAMGTGLRRCDRVV